MLLAVDIGNSLTKYAVFDGAAIIARFALATRREDSAEALARKIGESAAFPVRAVIISSVVPPLNEAYRRCAAEFLKTDALFVSGDMDLGLKIKYQPPENLGVDRFVAAFAAAEKYGKPCIVCDFGTAATIDFVTADNEFAGGVIMPGMRLAAEALFAKTANLPNVPLEKPASIIGNSTVTAIQAGIFYGLIGATGEILRRMIAASNVAPRVVATGGYAELVKENCPLIETVDGDLMLEGLRRIYEKINGNRFDRSEK